MSISLKNITKFYDDFKALNDLSFEIGKGEIVGFLGPNGAGKSTTMKIITGFIPANTGEVHILGEKMSRDRYDLKQKIGYLPEQNPLYNDLYVEEFLEFVSKIYSINNNRKERIQEVLELTGLESEKKKKIGQLSKGYKQRVGLAQALIHDPDILILDEPVSGLDPNQILEIRKLIKSIGKDKTVILSSHIMQEVQAICTRVIIINKGCLIADQNISELEHIEKDKKYLEIQFKNEPVINDLKNINGVLSVANSHGNLVQLEYNADIDIREAIFSYATKVNNPILSMKDKAADLEAIFQKLTHKSN
jgi:ABC-2 type transport system ATP-binding protein